VSEATYLQSWQTGLPVTTWPDQSKLIESGFKQVDSVLNAVREFEHFRRSFTGSFKFIVLKTRRKVCVSAQRLDRRTKSPGLVND
jgi:hypothetical protein